jgi:hypothetical protein
MKGPMRHRWLGVLVDVCERKLRFRKTILALFFTSSALAANSALPVDSASPTSTAAPEAHSDIVERIAAVRLALKERDASSEVADEPPARTMQWGNWPNWNNWNNWRNWNNWGNWNNY